MNKNIIIGAAALCAVIGLTSAGAFAADASADNIAETAAASQERIYSVGSVSKVYVTAAVMQLADEGRVELDAPITKYIPEFKMADERYKKITVRMLMDHTSGINGTVSKDESLYADNVINYDSYFEILSHQRLRSEPGEYAAYCNDGFCLLHIIVEKVTGMSFTDYLRKNISDRIGAEHTGTPTDMFENENNVPIYCMGNVPHDYEYCMGLGSGGIYSTASELAEFGGTFFAGDETLISENAKNEMSVRWDSGRADTADSDYTDKNGLGWDYVEKLHYEQAGVKVLGKGGDLGTMHAHLMVAPEEKISAAVLSAGGNSMYNDLMAQALLDAVLEEMGKPVDKSLPDIQTADTLPPECAKYEGFYSIINLSEQGVIRVYIEDGRLYTVPVGIGNTSPSQYEPTADGGFVKVDDSGNITSSHEVMYFEEKDGKTYIKGSEAIVYPGLGNHEISLYCGERMEDNDVPDSVLTAWNKCLGRHVVMYSNRYSSTSYDDPFVSVISYDEPKGYIGFAKNSGEGSALRLKDENRAEFFTTTPSSASRDVFDIEINDVTLSDGTVIQSLDLSSGTSYRFADELPELTEGMNEIALFDGEARWYRIGKDMGGKSIFAERPDCSVIYVYNKFRELVYTSHMKDAPNEIPLPPDGYILFHGKTGDSVKIFK